MTCVLADERGASLQVFWFSLVACSTPRPRLRAHSWGLGVAQRPMCGIGTIPYAKRPATLDGQRISPGLVLPSPPRSAR